MTFFGVVNFKEHFASLTECALSAIANTTGLDLQERCNLY